MDIKNSDMGSNMENAIPHSGNIRDYQSERPRFDYGGIVRINSKFNRNKMGETIAIKALNVVGWILVVLGISPATWIPLNDIVGLIIKLFAIGFMAYKLLNAHESWRIKRVERKRIEDEYNERRPISKQH